LPPREGYKGETIRTRGEARMSKNPFIDHPASVGETYGEHLRAASAFGFSMILGGLACLVHGVLPFCFLRTGSSTIARLHDRMVVNRRRAHVAPAFTGKAQGAQPLG
jgi:hypothetical protein